MENLPTRPPQYQVPLRRPQDYVVAKEAYPISERLPRELTAEQLRHYLAMSADGEEVVSRQVRMPATTGGRNTMYSVQGLGWYMDNSTKVQVVVKRDWSRNLFKLALWAVGLFFFFCWLHYEVMPTVKKRPVDRLYEIPIPPANGYPANHPAWPGGRWP